MKYYGWWSTALVIFVALFRTIFKPEWERWASLKFQHNMNNCNKLNNHNLVFRLLKILSYGCFCIIIITKFYLYKLNCTIALNKSPSISISKDPPCNLTKSFAIDRPSPLPSVFLESSALLNLSIISTGSKFNS